jgi:acetyltransferase-like isoleucine patch superfamily enzyme
MIGGFKRFDGVYLKKTRISNTTFIDQPERLKIEDNVFIGHHNYIDASNGLFIGEGSHIASFVSITTHSAHNSIRLYGDKYAGPDMIGYIKGSVEIGKYSFIGPHTVIMPGTKIGKGSIVAAYSYVQGEFPDFSILAGNPAKIKGSTKDLDEIYLRENSELMENYKKWNQ